MHVLSCKQPNLKRQLKRRAKRRERLLHANVLMLKLFDIDNETSASVTTVPEQDSVGNLEIDGTNISKDDVSALESELAKRKKRNRRSYGKPGSERRYEQNISLVLDLCIHRLRFKATGTYPFLKNAV